MKKVYWLFIIMIFSLIMGLGPKTHADNSVYQVGTDQLNVRSSPNHEATVVGSLSRGDNVTVFKEKYGWVQTYLNGQAVWVASQYLITTSSEQASKTVNNVTTDIGIVENGVHIRTGPGTDYTIHEIASKGDTYTLIDTKEDWHKIKLSNNKDAWVAAWLTDTQTTNHVDQSTVIAKNLSSIVDKSLVGYNIVLDAGHGGHDPGAISARSDNEKDIALEVTKQVAKKLRSEGATVILTRSDDSYVSLNERVKISDDYWTHAFVSLHFNAFSSNGSHGISTHYTGGKDSNQLAQHMQQALTNHTGLRDRGVQQDNFFVLRETNAVSVLAELGFMTNSKDLGVITQDSYADDVANAISDGLKGYFHSK